MHRYPVDRDVSADDLFPRPNTRPLGSRTQHNGTQKVDQKLLIVRTVMMVGFGVFFIIAPFALPLNMNGLAPKLGISAIGAAIIGFEAWSWKRRSGSSQ